MAVPYEVMEACEQCDTESGQPVLCRMSVCFWGHTGFTKTKATLLSAADMKHLHSVHARVQRKCSRFRKLVPELVARSAAVGGVVAEVASTSSKHRRTAANRALGDYRGVFLQSNGAWGVEIRVSEDGKNIQHSRRNFDTKEEAAQMYDTLALYLHRGYVHLLNRMVSVVVHILGDAKVGTCLALLV